MARFDVYRFANKASPLVVNVQADLLDELSSRVVIPLSPVTNAGKEELPRLKPKLEINGKQYILMTTDIAALPVKRLGNLVTNIQKTYQNEITGALDFLYSGF